MAFSSMRPWLAGAAVALSITGAAHAQDAKTLFEARYAEMSAATQARDLDKLHTMMTPDFVMTDIRGDEHTADEMGGMMGPRRSGGDGKPPEGKAPQGPGAPGGAPEVPRPVPRITILSAAITGATAQVEQQLEIHLDRPGPDGNPAKIDITVLTDDVWVQSGGNWLLKSSDQKDVSVSKDGDVVFHQAK